MTESTAKLLKFKSKDLTAYLGKLVNDSSNNNLPHTKIVSSIGQSRGLMSFSTLNDGTPSTLLPVLQNSESDPLTEFEIEASMKDDVFDDTEATALVITKPASFYSKNSMIQERDLIDSEFEAVVEEFMKPNHAVNESESTIVPESTPQSQTKSKKKRQQQKNGKKSSGESKVRLKQEERELMAKVKRVEMEKLAREVSLNKSLIAYLDMCVFTSQLNRGFHTLNYYRNRSKNFSQHPAVTDVAAFDCLLHGFAQKVRKLESRFLYVF